MGRRKKVAVNKVVISKTKRQTTKQCEPPSDNISLDSDNASASQDTSAENDSQDSNSTNDNSHSSHKKFGKFRCLLPEDNKYQTVEGICEEDSESGSNLEVRVVDPHVSSESDQSNSPAYMTNQSKELKTFSKADSKAKPSTSKEKLLTCISPCESGETSNSIPGYNTLDLVSSINLHNIMEYDTQIPDPTLDLISECDPRRGSFATSSLSLSFNLESGDCEQNGDEEMIPVYKIIEENGSEYYNLKTEDSMYPDSVDSSDRVAVVLSSDSNSSKGFDLPGEYTHYNVDAQALSDFESKISSMNLSSHCNTIVTNTDSNDSKYASEDINKVEFDNIFPKSSSDNGECSVQEIIATSDKVENVSESAAPAPEEQNTTGVRRSSRIKIISDLRQRSKGRGLVKTHTKKTDTSLVKEVLVKVSESLCDPSKKPTENFPSSPACTGAPLISPCNTLNPENDPKPVKVKSRWRRSSEMEMGSHSPITPPLQSPNGSGTKLPTLNEHSSSVISCKQEESIKSNSQELFLSDGDEETRRRLKQFETIFENEYHCDRAISKEAKKMTCDCFLTKDELDRGELGCGEDCLNRLLMIECNSRCPVGDRCTNRRFQNRLYSELRVVRTNKKGLGLQAINFIPGGEFLMEYVGEVLNSKQFNQKAEDYSSSDKNVHHYFMALKGDAVIDATLKGNISRFINHSCDPNSETQKWTVNGELRIGFFSKRDIAPGEEITFDYQFQRYGKEAQKCYCEASCCRGWIGEQPDSDSEEEEEVELEEKKPTELVKTELPEGMVTQMDVKQEVKTEKENDETDVVKSEPAKMFERHKKRDRPKKFARAAKELLEDVDLEEDMEMLSRSGIKNQSHTLSLCRAMVRAKRESVQITLLTLLAAADLPCRRLFLDYRGLRLLAPWCQDANPNFRLNMLIALEKLPIPNKTILKECNLITYIEEWLSLASPTIESPQEESDSSGCGTPVLIDERTGLPVVLPLRLNHKTEPTFTNTEVVSLNESINKNKNSYDSVEQKDKITKLCKLLLDRWSHLKEVFKIPKKERIEIMKEHERQANEPHTKKDSDKESTRVRKTRWEERYSRPERPLDRDKKRPRPPSPDSQRKVKLDERSPLSKEERRREFAERAAREEQMRKSMPQMFLDGVKKGPLMTLPPNMNLPPTWLPPPDLSMPSFGPVMMGGAPPPEFLMAQGIPPNYMSMDYMQQKPFMLPYCGPPQPMYMHQGFPVIGPRPPFQSMGPPPNMSIPPMVPQQGVHNIPPTMAYSTMPPINTSHPLPSSLMSSHPSSGVPRPQTPPLPHPVLGAQTIQSHLPPDHFKMANVALGYPLPNQIPVNGPVPQNVSTPTDENQDAESDVAVPFAPVRLPSYWRSVKDVKGRTYYYHIKLRISQWEPPLYSPTPHSKDDASSSSEEENSEEEKEIENGTEVMGIGAEAKEKLVEGVNGIYKVDVAPSANGLNLNVTPKKIKKNRPGLVTGCWIISPRKEEDRIANQLELKKYKENKEKLRRRKEQALLAAAQNEAIIKYKKKLKDRHKKVKKKESELVAEETARRKKEIFKVNMAKVMVQHLNPFRKEDCPIGRITNTADFKHLARKLSHFVLLKELKHCRDVNELDCNDSVKQKAKEFVKKYMAKFGAVYERPPEEID